MKLEEFKVDLVELVKEEDITPNQLFLYLCIKYQNKDLFLMFTQIETSDKIKHDLYKLFTKGYINKSNEDDTFDFDLMFINTDIGKNVTKQEKLEPFCKQIYELFPLGIKNGAYPLRSGEKDFIAKLIKFIKANPEYSLETIRKAVESYLAEIKKNNYRTFTQAGYFIYKRDEISRENKSMLGEWCEIVLNKKEEIKPNFESRL